MAKTDVKDLVRQFEDNQQAIAEANRKIEAAVGAQIAKKEELEKQNKQMKDAIYDAMEAADAKDYDGDLIKIVRVLPSKRSRFDAKAFKESHPRLHKKFLTSSEVKGYVKISVKA